MNIKDKLIHWLGGYTAKEYEKEYAVSHMQIPVFKVEKPIKTIKVFYSCDKYKSKYIPFDIIKEDLAHKLAIKALDEGLILFKTKGNFGLEDTETMALIKVIETYTEGEYGVF